MKSLVRALVAAALLLVAGLASRSALAEYGRCSFSSDCHPGVKCNGGRCADSAGASCSFSSECGPGGYKCNSGKCSNAPDGTCSFDSECGPRGKCQSSRCEK